MKTFTRIPPLLIAAVLVLAGCQSEEERAEEYYQSALDYIDQGDVERAQIELRNVFDNDGFHREARQLYADLLLQEGDRGAAYSQLLRLVEQYPDDVRARTTLAELAVDFGRWDEAQRHGGRAMELAPDAPRSRAIGAVLAYRDAAQNRDAAARVEALETAREIVEEQPDSMTARRILISEAIDHGTPEEVLAQVDAALQIRPESLELNMMRAQYLERTGATEELGAQLARMYDLFPEDERIARALSGWYLAQEDFEGAETFLRGEAGAPEEDTDGNLAVVRLLRQTEGPDAARAELEKLVEAAEGSAAADLYGATLAALDFDDGRRQEAVDAIEAILQGAEPSDQTRRIKMMQARMLAATGNEVGARARIEEVLEEDRSNIDALKMRAERLIAEDRPGQAIADLRSALDQAPRDTEILSTMAEAHLRDGSPELAQEQLAQAVQISNNAAPESLRYARFLVERDRAQLAQSVLTAIERPTMDSYALLGQVMVQNEDWAQARSLVETLREMDDPRAEKIAQSVQTAILFRQDRIEEGLAALESNIEGADDLEGTVQVLRAQIAAGRPEEARAFLDERVAEAPDDENLQRVARRLDALLLAVSGDTEGAKAAYRAILEEEPGAATVALQLHSLLQAEGETEAAEEVIREAAAAAPESRNLQLVEAARLERAGDFEGAIEIYERLYERDSGDIVVANNLASLLTTARSEPGDLERAFAIARRLNGSDVPAFRDTLGWIRHLRGQQEEAISDLEFAARGMPEVPSVAFHLGLAYAAAGRTDAARAEIERGLELAGDDANVPQRAEAEAALSSF